MPRAKPSIRVDGRVAGSGASRELRLMTAGGGGALPVALIFKAAAIFRPARSALAEQPGGREAFPASRTTEATCGCFSQHPLDLQHHLLQLGHAQVVLELEAQWTPRYRLETGATSWRHSHGFHATHARAALADWNRPTRALPAPRSSRLCSSREAAATAARHRAQIENLEPIAVEHVGMSSFTDLLSTERGEQDAEQRRRHLSEEHHERRRSLACGRTRRKGAFCLPLRARNCLNDTIHETPSNTNAMRQSRCN